MRYVLPWSGDRPCCIYVWNRLAAGQSAPILSAGVADCTGSDRGRAVPAAVLKEGKAYEGCCMEKSQVLTRDPVLPVSCKQGIRKSAFADKSL